VCIDGIDYCPDCEQFVPVYADQEQLNIVNANWHCLICDMLIVAEINDTESEHLGDSDFPDDPTHLGLP
jgi:hypothetical protein